MQIKLTASVGAIFAVPSFLKVPFIVVPFIVVPFILVPFIAVPCIVASATTAAVAAEDTSSKNSKPETPKIEIIPLNAQDHDVVEHRLFKGQLPPAQQLERSAPLLDLSNMVVDYPSINISEARKDPKSGGKFTIDQYAIKKLSETLAQLGIKTEPSSPAAIKIHGAISGAQNELSLIVLDDLTIERLPNRKYRTIIFSTTETEGTAEQMVDRLCIKFAKCWLEVNKEAGSGSNGFKSFHSDPFGGIPKTKIVKGTPTMVTDIELVGVSNSFEESQKREKQLRQEAEKNNSQLLNNFPRMKMQDRFRNATLLGETQFLTGMNADQLIETLGMPNMIRDSNGMVPGSEKRFSSKRKLVQWLMQEFSRAQLTYECGTKEPRPKMVIDIRNYKVTGTSLVNF